MSKVTVFDNSVAFATATNTPEPDTTSYWFSGIINPEGVEFNVGVIGSKQLWFSIAARDNSIELDVATTGTDISRTIVPGMPLHEILFEPGETITSIEVSNSDADKLSDVEIHIYSSTLDVDEPDPAFLILNAGTGIGIDPFETDKVISWTDTRPESGAPLPFLWSDGSAASTTDTPDFVSSDPDFGGKPSVSWVLGNSSNYYQYTTASSTIFDFMRGRAEAGQDFTVMSILSVEDTATPSRISSGIWNTVKSGSYAGFKGSVEGGYRVYTQLSEGAGSTDVNTKELIEKPSVIIWRFEGSAQELRVYRQGEWSGPIDMSHTAGGSVSSSPFEVGFTHESGQSTFQGKMADIRVYDSAVGQAVYGEYIEMAVDEYGIDDTSEQGMPRISNAFDFHRANRGFSSDVWYDMRIENYPAVTPGTPVVEGNNDDFVTVNDALLGSQPVIEFNGVDDFASNTYSGSGDHLAGDSPGMTIAMVYYQTGDTSIRGLFTMEDYDTNVDLLAGTNIEYPGQSSGNLRYEIDNAAGGTVIRTAGEEEDVSTPRAIVFRSDGTNYYVNELNLLTGVTTSSSGALTGTPSSTTSLPVYLFTYPSQNPSDFLAGSLAEYWTEASDISDDSVDEYFAYCQRRYV